MLAGATIQARQIPPSDFRLKTDGQRAVFAAREAMAGNLDAELMCVAPARFALPRAH